MASNKTAGSRPAATLTLKYHLLALAELLGIRTDPSRWPTPYARISPRWESKLRHLTVRLYHGAMTAGMFLLDNVIPLYFTFSYKNSSNVHLVLVYARPLPDWIVKILTEKPVYKVIDKFRDFMEGLVYSYVFDEGDYNLGGHYNISLLSRPDRFIYKRLYKAGTLKVIE
jgi:hypothetical protein